VHQAVEPWVAMANFLTNPRYFFFVLHVAHVDLCARCEQLGDALAAFMGSDDIHDRRAGCLEQAANVKRHAFAIGDAKDRDRLAIQLQEIHDALA
jgi:hypothetical protein